MIHWISRKCLPYMFYCIDKFQLSLIFLPKIIRWKSYWNPTFHLKLLAPCDLTGRWWSDGVKQGTNVQVTWTWWCWCCLFRSEVMMANFLTIRWEPVWICFFLSSLLLFFNVFQLGLLIYLKPRFLSQSQITTLKNILIPKLSTSICSRIWLFF